MELKKIGMVGADDRGFYVQLDEAYKEALTAMEGFSHVNVLWWADQLEDSRSRQVTLVNKPYKPGPEKVGIFATRSPQRPNPICTTIVNVLELSVEEGVVRIPYIDAEPGTPVLDIKVYLPCSDHPKESHGPAWSELLPDCIEDSATFDWEGYFNF